MDSIPDSSGAVVLVIDGAYFRHKMPRPFGVAAVIIEEPGGRRIGTLTRHVERCAGAQDAEMAAFDMAVRWLDDHQHYRSVTLLTDCELIVKHAHQTGLTSRRRYPRVRLQCCNTSSGHKHLIYPAHRACTSEAGRIAQRLWDELMASRLLSPVPSYLP